MHTNSGAIWAAIIALFLGVAVVTQFRSQDVYSRSLNLETPSSLTTLIANLSETNNELRNEISDLRRDVASAQDSVSSGRGSLTEAERQIAQLRVFSAQSAVAGPGIAIKIDGAFDERALSDLAVTFYLEVPPASLTGHPGARATTYFVHGNLVSAADLPEAKHVDHWYQISAVDVLSKKGAASMVALGDSITDGHGATTNGKALTE